MTEAWRDVVGYEGLYQVSDMGRVRITRTDRILKARLDKDGYLLVNLWQPSPVGRYTTVKVHRIVLLAFKGDPPEGAPRADHRNGQRADNSLTNLRWATPSENGLNRHAPSTGATGVLGVNYRQGKPNPWRAHVTVNGKQKSLGHHASLDLAAAARRSHMEALNA